MPPDVQLGSLGAWVPRSLPAGELASLATALEDAGYGAIWISGGGEPGVFATVAAVLGETSRIPVATGVVNLWMETPATVTEAWHRLEERHPGRLLVGLGISHAPLVERAGAGVYEKPLARTRAFLDALDAEPDPLPPGRRVLGALGPRMLALAAERPAGAHPYLVTADGTARARAGVGPDRLVAPELGVVLEPDLPAARDLAREALTRYLGLPNYTNTWLRSGFTADDLADGGSDRQMAALVALGDPAAVARRVAEHREAGADHVAVQVLGPRPHAADAFRALAGEL